jgi:hypothetical protein
VYAETPRIFGKRLQILKEAVPLVSKVAFLTTGTWQGLEQLLRKAGLRLEISVVDMVVKKATPSELQRVFAEIALDRLYAITDQASRRRCCVPRN